MNFSLVAILAAIALAGLTQLAAAAPSKPYPAQVSAEIADGRKECLSVGGKSMTASAEAVELSDVNGDGLPDYLVDYGQFQCNGAASSNLYCGTAGCPVVAFVAAPNKQYVQVSLGHLRGYTVVKADNLTLLQVNLHGSACGQVGAYDCVKRLRYASGRFEPYPPEQTAKVPAPQVPLVPTAKWQLMTLRNGQKVAFVRPGGRVSSLSLGCQAGGPTMMIEAQAGAVRGTPAVVLRGRNGMPVSSMPATRQNNFVTLRPVSSEVVGILTGPDNQVALEIGNAMMADIPTNGAKAALDTALAGCKPSQSVAKTTKPNPVQPAPLPTSSAAKGVLGVPIRHGYYVAEYEQCRSAGSVTRFGPKGHAEIDAASKQWVEIPWRKAVRRQDGFYAVEFVPAPGELPGDEIEISIKPLSETRMEMVIQDSVIMRLCERSQLPPWVR
jgi:hypothetical protein